MIGCGGIETWVVDSLMPLHGEAGSVYFLHCGELVTA